MYDPTLFDVRTDLAVEETERQKEQGLPPYPGVSVEEYDHNTHPHSEHGNGQYSDPQPNDNQRTAAPIHVTCVRIQSEEGAWALGKSMGTYITLDAGHMVQNDGQSHREVSRVLASYLRDLMEPHLPQHLPPRHQQQTSQPYPQQPQCKQPTSPSALRVLVVGLGNTDVTPDALGPRVLSNVLITRHLQTGQFQMPEFSTEAASVCGIVPGVMAQTGMETAEIVKALTEQVHPDLIIVIDALAARSVTRLGTTIQLTDTGIHPGSGVGNHRHSLTQDSLGVPVIAIGVPTVVGAAAIVTDTLDALIDVLCQETDTEHFADALRSMGPDEKYALVRELLEPRFGPMFVTPKDIDETVKRISFTISEGINMALFEETHTTQ